MYNDMGEQMITVYADVLVALNILFTYIFLVCTRAFTRIPTYKWGVALASLTGGMSSLIILFGEINIFLSISFKILSCAIIVFLSFLPNSIRSFFKVLLTFFGVSVIFGGAMYFIEITLNSHKILYLNGTVYFDMDIKYLSGTSFLIYGAFLAANYFSEKRAFKNELYKVTVWFENTSVTLTGFVDTGNSLTDPLTGRFVFIGELGAFSPLFTYEQLLFLKSNVLDIPKSLQGKIHLIPASTVGESSLLKAFIPDKTEIMINKKKTEVKNACIAIVNKKLSAGEYSLLLNKNAVDFER